MKKTYLLILTVFLSVLFTVSCGSKKPTIQLAIWDNEQQAGEQEAVNNFMKANPGINVKIQFTPWDQYFTKASAAAEGNELCDVMWMDLTQVGRFTSGGFCAPIDDMVKNSGIDLSAYPEGSVNAYKFEGKLYALPRDIDSIAVWYNKKIFDAAGVPYPKDNWKWADMVKAAIFIKSKVKDVYPVMMEYTGGQGAWYNMISQCGGYLLTPDKKKSGWSTPEALQAIKMMRNLIDVGASPDAESLGDANGIMDLFASDKVAMFYGGSWVAYPFAQNEIIRDHIGVVEMPSIKKKATAAHSIGYMISSKTKNPDAAFKLVAYLAGKEAQELLAKSGVVMPAYKEVQHYWAEAPCYKDVNLDVSAHVRALSYSVMVPGTKDTGIWNDLEIQELNNVWAGKEKPDVVVPRLAKGVDDLLAKE